MQHTQNIFPVGVRREEENETPARPDWAEEAAQGSEARRDDAVRSEGDLQLVDTGRGRRRSCRARAHCMGLRARIGGCEMTTETRTITGRKQRMDQATTRGYLRGRETPVSEVVMRLPDGIK